jgi:hypothetical protein
LLLPHPPEHYIKLQLGNDSAIVDLYVPLQFIIGDVECGDQLCSRFSYHGIVCNCLCRTCDVSFDDSADTTVYCQWISVADVLEVVAGQDRAELRQLAQRPFFNSLYHIDCGNDPYGVFSMVHTAALHCIKMGLMEYMMTILLLEMKKKAFRQELDDLVIDLLKHSRQHGYEKMPRILWQDGVTHLTNLTADLKVGKMFAVIVVASTREGEALFTKALQGGTATWRKMLYVFQQIFCYWMWLKEDTYWMTDDVGSCQQASDAIRIMMHQLQSLWPREDGFGWNLMKIHEQFHVPEDIHRKLHD